VHGDPLKISALVGALLARVLRTAICIAVIFAFGKVAGQETPAPCPDCDPPDPPTSDGCWVCNCGVWEGTAHCPEGTQSCDDGCCETGPHVSDWTCCQEGSVLNPGTLSSTSITNCVGGCVALGDLPGVWGLQTSDGQACQTTTWDCKPSVTSTAEVWYSAQQVDFDPPISDKFTEPGDHPFTASVRGVYWEGGGWVCPEYTAPAPVGPFTVVTVGDGSLQSDQGYDRSGLTNIVDWAPSGAVVVTATPTPNIPPDNLPPCWNMSGGTEVSRTVHTVPKSSPGFYTIIAQAGTSSKTQVVVVVRCQFTGLARCGAPSSDGFGAPFLGHAWWSLAIEPSAAKALLGGNPNTGPQKYVNQDAGYACGTCLSLPPSCQGPGVMWLDGANGTPTDFAIYTWDITYAAFAVGAQATFTLASNLGTYNCLYRNCALEAAAIADQVGEYLPNTDQPCTTVSYLQQLNGY
jgi:hypothetical protein